MTINSFSSSSTPSATRLTMCAIGMHRLLHQAPRTIFCFFLFLSLLISAKAQDSKSAARGKVSQAQKAVESPINYAGISYRPGDRRDPFWNPAKQKKSSKTEDEEISRGLPPPGIAGTYIAQAILEGISIREDRISAIVRGADNRAYFLREGDRLFDGYLKTIQEDSITLVRETKMRSGKTLTQDVTKRLRTP
jgi:Tfp pilus assembly protein PilP